MGKLEVNIIPVDPNGDPELPDELLSDNPMDLVGQRIDFIVELKQAYDLPKDFCKDVYCEYMFYLDNEKYKTQKI